MIDNDKKKRFSLERILDIWHLLRTGGLFGHPIFSAPLLCDPKGRRFGDPLSTVSQEPWKIHVFQLSSGQKLMQLHEELDTTSFTGYNHFCTYITYIYIHIHIYIYYIHIYIYYIYYRFTYTYTYTYTHSIYHRSYITS